MGFGTLLQSSAALSVISKYVKKKNQDSGGTSVKRVKVRKKKTTSEASTKNVKVQKS